MIGQYPELENIRTIARNRLMSYSKELRAIKPPQSALYLYGKDLASLTSSTHRDPASFTCQNPNYWRALMESAENYELALLTNAYVYAAYDHLSWAKIWLILAYCSNERRLVAEVENLWKLIETMDGRLHIDIQKGIQLHDQGKYQEAIRVYDGILANYPYSARAYYEKGYSLSAEDIIGNQKIVKSLLEKSLKCDPFYSSAYVIKDKDEREIFTNEVSPFLTASHKTLDDFRTFAYGCHKLSLFEIAGHVIWQLLQLRPDDRDLAFHFIVCLTESRRMELADLARDITSRLLPDIDPKPDQSEKSKLLEDLRSRFKELTRAGDYRGAFQIALKEHAYVSESYGTSSLELARASYDLGTIYFELGNIDDAETFIRKTIAIYELDQSSNLESLGSALNTLAMIYRRNGQLIEAEAVLRRVIEIWNTAFSPRDFELSLAYNNLCSVLIDQGRETEARKFIQQAIYISDNTWVPPHYKSTQARYRLTLETIERKLGNLFKAEQIITDAQEMFHEEFESDPRAKIHIEQEFAEIYLSKGDYSKTADHLEIALNLQRALYGAEHSEIASTLNNLGEIYRRLGKDQEAEQLLLESLALRRKLLGPNHPAVATPLNNLSLLYARERRLEDAARFLREALKIREATLSQNHPDLIQTIENLGILCAELGKFDEAIILMKRSLRLDEQLMAYRLSNATEREKRIAFETIGRDFDKLISLVYKYLPESEEALNVAFEAVIRRKGLVSEMLVNEYTSLLQKQKVSKDLQFTTGQLASLAIGGPRTLPLDQYAYILMGLIEKLHALEIDISSSDEEISIRLPTLKEIQERIPDDVVLIEYVVCSLFNLSDPDEEQQKIAQHYFAVATNGRNPSKLMLVDLGEIDEINRLLRQYMSEFEVLSLAPVTAQYELNAEKVLANIGEEISKRILAPLQSVIGGVKKIYLAPDGELNLFPFAALPAGKEHYLIEEYEITYLNTSRDLLGFRFENGSSQGIYIVADPDYQTAAYELAPEIEELPQKNTSLSSFFRTQKWKRLENSLEEANAIAKELLPIEPHVFTGEKARKQLIKEIVNPCVLHIATHGFFLEDETLESLFPPLISEQDLFGDPPEASDKYIAFSFPALLRSGLVFSGANQISRAPISADIDNGILTALEASTLNFRDTELVVLSACETGLGLAQYGDAVIGLRRAFHVAGTQTIVMSLWSIPDKETKELMIEFYKNIKNGMGRSKALQQATMTIVNQRREKQGTAHPYYWGAFICVGNPSPMTLRSQPLLLQVNKIECYELISDNTKTVYTTAGDYEGCEVFGRGQRITISLINTTPYSFNIDEVKIKVLSQTTKYKQTLRYDKLQLPIPHTAAPDAGIYAPIYLVNSSIIPSNGTCTIDSNIHLDPVGKPNSVHQITYTVEAKSAGLHVYQIEINYDNLTTGQSEKEVFGDKFSILLRGK